jgi:acyl dehydratase
MAGLYFEDFEVGRTYRHNPARTVTAFDDLWFSCMTMNTQPLHINLDFSKRQGMYGKNLFNSVYTMSIIIGQTTTELTRGTLLETVCITDIEFPRPVFHDDTLYSRTTVLSKDDNVVELFHEGLNQDEQIVATFKRKVRMRNRGA